MERNDYGFARTVCACDACKGNCAHLSGMVAPEDLRRWAREWQKPTPLDDWLMYLFAASPGAKVLWHGEVVAIRTIVPARREDHGCTFWTPTGQCLIHETAPYGCAFFDEHMSPEEGRRRSEIALVEILYDWATAGAYSQLWHRLWQEYKRVEAPEIARQRLRLRNLQRTSYGQV
jgi:hypothetical protein